MEALLIFLAVAAVLAMEAIPWFLFRKKLIGIQFPHELDTSFFRFFTIGRVRLLIIGHTIFLLSILLLGFFFLW